MQLPQDKQARKALPLASGCFDYFPDALAAVANVSHVGNAQHNPGQPMRWDRSKSTDHADCLMRHMLERGTLDTDGLRHSAKVAWRALAQLQVEIEGDIRGHSIADRPKGEVVDNDGKSYFPQLVGCTPVYSKPDTTYYSPGTVRVEEESTAIDPHAPGVAVTLQMVYGKLKTMGCAVQVAELIAKGVTLSAVPFGPKQRFVYIAGPMRGQAEFNFPAFDMARDYMVRNGYNVISPADIDRADTSAIPLSERQAEFALRDSWSLFFLKAGHSGNGVVLLPGWEKSTGAAGEFFLARWLGLKFYTIAGKDNACNSHPGRLRTCSANDLLQDFALKNATVQS